MIKITRTTEPLCLTILKNKEGATYDDLQGDCDKEVREKLFLDQKNLCAYCQRIFTSKVFIEHYIPQSTTPEKQLDYDNFLGVCSGKYYLDKATGKAIIFCSVNRGNQNLTIDPSNQSHITTLSYDEENRICSSNSIFQNELDETLNLNFDNLCDERKIELKNELKAFQEMAYQMGLSPIDTYTKAIKSVKMRNPAYSGFLIYKFSKSLEYHQNKLE